MSQDTQTMLQESHTIPVDSQDLGQYGRQLATRFEDRIQS